jgi:hypothetical protein
MTNRVGPKALGQIGDNAEAYFFPEAQGLSRSLETS